MMSIRAFIALDLSEEARAVLSEVSESLARRVSDQSVKWVAPESTHLTLRFLGNTSREQLNDIYAALDNAAAQHERFTLYLDRLGCFPNDRRPRVIWVGVRGDVAQVVALQQSVEDALVPLGWEPEKRPFHPHLTLGRVKDNRTKIELPWGKGIAPAPLPVRELHLFESELRRSGAIYTVRHTSRLGKLPQP